MNILYLAHRIPYPPNKGDKLRAFHQIKKLSENHDVTVASFVDNPDDEKYIPELRKHCSDVVAIRLNTTSALLRGLTGLVTGGTITEHYYALPAMNDALTALSMEKNFDIVVAFSSSMIQYVNQIRASRKVIDFCDLDSQKWLLYAGFSNLIKKYLYTLEGKRLAQKELQWIDQYDASIVITDDEITSIPDRLKKKIHVVSNGVTVPDENTVQPHKEYLSSPVIGFVGVMDYFPNVDAVCWFAHQIWPHVQKASPDASFKIVGRNPVRKVKQLDSIPGIDVVGEVDDISSEISNMDVSVAPLRVARGLQNKVLEAMSHAKPVVMTESAALGLLLSDIQRECIADDPKEFAEKVIKIISSAEYRKNLSRTNRSYVEHYHNWDDHLEKFESVVTGISKVRTTEEGFLHLNQVLITDPKRAAHVG